MVRFSNGWPFFSVSLGGFMFNEQYFYRTTKANGPFHYWTAENVQFSNVSGIQMSGFRMVTVQVIRIKYLYK